MKGLTITNHDLFGNKQHVLKRSLIVFIIHYLNMIAKQVMKKPYLPDFHFLFLLPLSGGLSRLLAACLPAGKLQILTVEPKIK